MKTNKKALLNIAVSLAAAGMLAAPFAASADIPKEGNYDYTACWSGVSNPIQFSKTQSAFTYEMTGTINSNPPGGFLDKHSSRCVGLNMSLNGKNSIENICEAFALDGDKILTRFSSTSGGAVSREVVAGTGKYEGLVSTGVAKPLGPFPSAKPGAFQACNHQTGTYKMM